MSYKTNTILANNCQTEYEPTLDNGGLLYVYLFKRYTFCRRIEAKIGVSKNPEKRRFYFDLGGFEFYKKYGPFIRKDAYSIEAQVKKHFKKNVIKSECFNISYKVVEKYLESII